MTGKRISNVDTKLENYKFSVGDKVRVKYLVDNGRGHTSWLEDKRDAKVIDVIRESRPNEDYQYLIEFEEESFMIDRRIKVHERELEFRSELEARIREAID